MDQVAYLFERVLRARSPQDNIEQRADEFGGGAQKVNLSRDQIQPGEFLALDQHVVRDRERPGLAIELELDLPDQFFSYGFVGHEITQPCTRWHRSHERRP
jgi:hypothetical protein